MEKNTQRRIIHFTDSLGPGGKERRLTELLKGFAQKPEWNVELVVMSEDIHYKEVHQYPFKIHILIRKIKKDPSIFFKFNNICRSFKPDIIQVWNMMPAIYAIPSRILSRCLLVNSIITDAPSNVLLLRKQWIWSKISFLFSDVIVANSSAGLETYAVTKQRSVCIHNGFDAARNHNLASPQSVRARLGIQTKFIVGMVASINRKKDYPTFILAALKILESRKDVTFVAVGDGVDLEMCKGSVPSDMQEHVKFVGKQVDVESIVNTFDVGVLATFTEGISNSIMEYMSLGKPVVATNGGGTKELVIDGVTGFLVRPCAPDELAERVNRLLRDKDLAASMGQAGAERIEKHFSLEAMVHQYSKLYEQLLLTK